jgi:hypothetical protein
VGLLRFLQSSDELSLELLDHLAAWRSLSPDQRSSMLVFFERSRLLCCVNQRSDMRLIMYRVRSKPHLTVGVENVTSKSDYHALYLLPLNHIGLIAQLQSAVSGLRLDRVKLRSESGCDSLLVHRRDSAAAPSVWKALPRVWSSAIASRACVVSLARHSRASCGLRHPTLACSSLRPNVQILRWTRAASTRVFSAGLL